MSAILLATKLRCPSIPPKWVRRPHLIQRLNEGMASGRPLTLVSAPAGFGKTTCVILEVLQALLTYLCQGNLAQPLRLVLLTREDPPLSLARLRA